MAAALSVLIVSLSGCGNAAADLKSNAEVKAGGQSIESAAIPSAAAINADVKMDYIDLKDLPADYSEKMAVRDGVVVEKMDSLLNSEYLYRFCDRYADGLEAFVRVMSYTTEGDPIITDFTYDKDMITMTIDSRRDRYGADTDHFYKKKYKYLVKHKGLLYLCNEPHWKDGAKEDEYRLLANIMDKKVWKEWEGFHERSGNKG